jgi:cell division transport system permease protein
VESVKYISKEEAQIRFKEEHKENPAIIKSIEEVDENPLFATINIKAKNLDDYPGIVDFLEREKGEEFIDMINYQESEKQISKLSSISKSAQRGGFAISVIFAALAILVAFNTIRIAMYSHHREVEIMRLVGATNWFIRLPFIVEGILFGIFGSVITMCFLYGAILAVSPRLIEFLPGFNLFDFFQAHFWEIFGIQLLVGVALGVISSLIAIRKYLKV